MQQKLYLLKPTVHRYWLFFMAGAMWFGVGILLNMIAWHWFGLFSLNQSEVVLTLGLIAGLLNARYGFGSLARKNRERIAAYPAKVCLFAFQRWQSYLLIIFMIGLGIFLRHSAFMPRDILAIIYMTVGLGLLLASFIYFRAFWDGRVRA